MAEAAAQQEADGDENTAEVIELELDEAEDLLQKMPLRR